jgi:hypothetical protein
MEGDEMAIGIGFFITGLMAIAGILQAILEYAHPDPNKPDYKVDAMFLVNSFVMVVPFLCYLAAFYSYNWNKDRSVDLRRNAG